MRHLATAFLVGLSALLTISGVPAHAQDPLPIEAFATRPVMSNVSLSPDGRYLAYRVAQNRTGDYYIEVRETDDLGGEPVRLGSDRMDITGFSWVSDEHLRVSFMQQVRSRIEGQNAGVFQSKQAIVRADGRGRFRELFDDVQLYSSLPDRPNEILIYTAEVNYEDMNADDIRNSGRSMTALVPDFRVLNVDTMRMQTYMRGVSTLGGYRLDNDANIRIAQSFEPSTRESIYWHRAPGETSEWVELFRTNAEERNESFSIIDFDPANPNMLFVSANRGQDAASVYEFNLVTGSFGERVFGADMLEGVPHQDIDSGWYSTDPATAGELLGFVFYDSDGERQIAFINPEEQALYQQLQATFPGREVTISSRSRGSEMMVIHTVSGDDPGTYYLLANGELQVIGNQRPTLPAEALADVEYIEYTARDGRRIPAYLTVPNGEGPFPLIVLPHGGPWVNFRTTGFDEWGQLLANNGYMVLEPLFRGTTGHGNDHWQSSFGEWGGAMSDDMDDGAQFLVEQGLVDPDRMAMFGWSFGGYSSFAASIRTPQIYQCAIAGAGVGDPIEFRAFFTRNRVGRAMLEEGYAGMNTINRAEDVNIPILVVHGDLDQRVRIYHSEQFVAQLERFNKPHRFVVLEGADHFDNTLTFDHRMTLYTELLGFLENECGPGGI
ncbi:prolyl oligopeptidase family serine peptidase [Maricaulis sp.]|uniref:alpha/beta hydrolase family protein n=1 Tax=Maricaulis sp. TaxID=1486257 RepID=UPI0025C6262F|nr:prolyl oligopeptidase family serine peptidase [Maricaulis sp.]